MFRFNLRFFVKQASRSVLTLILSYLSAENEIEGCCSQRDRQFRFALCVFLWEMLDKEPLAPHSDIYLFLARFRRFYLSWCSWDSLRSLNKILDFSPV